MGLRVLAVLLVVGAIAFAVWPGDDAHVDGLPAVASLGVEQAPSAALVRPTFAKPVEASEPVVPAPSPAPTPAFAALPTSATNDAVAVDLEAIAATRYGTSLGRCVLGKIRVARDLQEAGLSIPETIRRLIFVDDLIVLEGDFDEVDFPSLNGGDTRTHGYGRDGLFRGSMPDERDTRALATWGHGLLLSERSGAKLAQVIDRLESGDTATRVLVEKEGSGEIWGALSAEAFCNRFDCHTLNAWKTGSGVLWFSVSLGDTIRIHVDVRVPADVVEAVHQELEQQALRLEPFGTVHIERTPTGVVAEASLDGDRVLEVLETCAAAYDPDGDDDDRER